MSLPGFATYARFNQRGRFEDLEDAIMFCRMALDHLCPLGHPNRSYALNDLAAGVWIRFKHRGQIKDLEEAITYNREAHDLCPLGHPYHFTTLNNLASTVGARFDEQGRMEDLEFAITCHRQALDLLRPPGHPDRCTSLNNLAAVLHVRFRQLGQTKDLEEAITCHHEALDLCSPGHLSRFACLNNLAGVLCVRFEEQGQIEDLEEAITCNREALDLWPPGRPDRSMPLCGLGNALNSRFNERGQITDLEDAITCYREALDLCPSGRPDRSISLANLASAVNSRFNERGQIKDLEEAIACNREALDLHPLGHRDRFVVLSHLSVAVCCRFYDRGQIVDLEEAITCSREALDLCPPDHLGRSNVLHNLAVAVWARFNQREQIEDLEEAITCHRQELDLRPLGHPSRSSSLGDLALAVQARFKWRGEIEDLEEAITCHRQALDLRPLGHPGHSLSRYNLANALCDRSSQWVQTKDLEEAIEHLSEAEGALPIPHPLHASLRSSLASTYLIRHQSHSQLDDCVPRAFNLFESAANHSTSTSKERFDAAQQWALHARHYQHHSTVQAYITSLTLLDRHLSVTPDIELRQHLLATASSIPRSLASDAAASAISVGRLRAAVELLEQGRAILWSKLRGYRHPLEQLRDVDRQLADRFEELSGRLEHHTISSGSELTLPGLDKAGPAVSAGLDAKIRQHRILSEEWNEVVGRIRQIEGFTNFLQAVPFATLQLAAAEGPVIIVNISKYRSDAIILHGADLPSLVPLPDTSPTHLDLLSSQLSDALSKRSMRSIRKILRTLWNTIVRPVRDKLAILGVAEQSRIWWCPTSELCALPLHAAGPYKNAEKNLPEIYISSYTPTLATLIRARSGIMDQPALPKLLVMGQPGENLEIGKLANVREEIRHIHSFGDFVDVLVAGQANIQNVLPHLRQHNWIHFACHGYQAAEPFRSYFELYDDEKLTLIDLIRARLPNAEFAFLSACQSAAGDTGNTPNEVINLAAALQFCGFRSVVGTLWEMADIDGPDVAEDFYKYMFRDLGSVNFRDSAKALNVATQAMRKRKCMTIDRWINFVHIGA